MALVTAQDYILNALRKCGQMRPGYIPAPELLADALNEWEVLFDAWATDRTMGFSIPDYVYPVTGPGSQTGGNGYQIGPTAADWVGPRPVMIVRANLVMTNVGPQPVYIALRPLTAEQWAGLSIRQIPAINVTNVFYYDPQYPNGVFNVFPPLNGNSIELFCAQQLGTPATLATAYSAPPGYANAVIWSLAERLWPMCTNDIAIHKTPFERIAGTAYEACQKIQAVNAPARELSSDFRGSAKPDGYFDQNVTWTGEPY